jgi:predicted nucleic acid-binding protein
LREAVRRKTVRLLAPRLLAIEYANVSWKKVQRSMCDRAQARRNVETLPQIPIEYHSHSGLRMEAFDLACDEQCAYYDALYLALAEKTGSEIATMDGPMFTVAGRRGIPI